MTKYGMYGAIGQAGVVAALLVQAGFEGDCSILDGERGFGGSTALVDATGTI